MSTSESRKKRKNQKASSSQGIRTLNRAEPVLLQKSYDHGVQTLDRDSKYVRRNVKIIDEVVGESYNDDDQEFFDIICDQSSDSEKKTSGSHSKLYASIRNGKIIRQFKSKNGPRIKRKRTLSKSGSSIISEFTRRRKACFQKIVEEPQASRKRGSSRPESPVSTTTAVSLLQSKPRKIRRKKYHHSNSAIDVPTLSPSSPVHPALSKTCRIHAGDDCFIHDEHGFAESIIEPQGADLIESIFAEESAGRNKSPATPRSRRSDRRRMLRQSTSGLNVKLTKLKNNIRSPSSTDDESECANSTLNKFKILKHKPWKRGKDHSNEGECWIALIPDEMLHKIFSYIDGKTFLDGVQRVSRRFYALAQYDEIWRAITFDKIKLDSASLSFSIIPSKNSKHSRAFEEGRRLRAEFQKNNDDDVIGRFVKPNNRSWQWVFRSKSVRFKKIKEHAKPTGIGYHVPKNGLTRYEGEWLRGFAHGVGVMWKAGGSKYIGEWKQGLEDGFGIKRWKQGTTYTGYWKAGLEHGHGKKVWTTGGKYVGEWKCAKEHGKGKHTWADGSYYDGEWRNSEQHGYGKYVWETGNHFEGLWEHSRQKKGKYVWIDGREYDGEYSNGVKHGQGTYSWHDGTVYTGSWSNGLRSGHGRMEWSDGSVFEGKWVCDKRCPYTKSIVQKLSAPAMKFDLYFAEPNKTWQKKYQFQITERARQAKLCLEEAKTQMKLQKKREKAKRERQRRKGKAKLGQDRHAFVRSLSIRSLQVYSDAESLSDVELVPGSLLPSASGAIAQTEH